MTERFELHIGDCIAVMKTMGDASVDSIVTDPPYELGFMGKKWDNSGIAHNIEMWKQCFRVLKPGGHLLSFSGTRTQHRMVCAIEDAGFDIRDQIGWAYGSGFPKSHNLDGEWDGWGSALKPAHEPICVARKPFAGTLADNVAIHGTGAINIDGCRIHSDDAKCRSYTVKRFATGASVNKDGNWKQDAEFVGETKAGRWPANLIHDGSDEVLAAFPQAPCQLADASTNSEQRKTNNSYGLMYRGRAEEPSADSANLGTVGFKMRPGARRLDTGSAARFFYCAKTSSSERHEGLPKPPPQFKRGSTLRDAENLGNERSGNNHPTVKPVDLMQYLCRLVTPPNGRVLDPFCGSGSTGKASIREGLYFIGIDVTPEYINDIARPRIQWEVNQLEAIAKQADEAARQYDLFA